jgi:hypothetical protein
VRLQRRAIALAEVMPPVEYLMRKTWGLPE